jgi:hypothetical protein
VQVAEERSERIETYNTLIEPYNIQTIDAAIALASGESEASKKQREDIAQG